MTNNIFEKFDEIYSRWSILDKMGKEMQLECMWQQLTSAYNYLMLGWRIKGYLTLKEANYANQINQMLRDLLNQKMKVDHDLANEMIKHLVKMNIKHTK